MNLLERIKRLRQSTARKPGTGRIAIVHWDREQIYFLVVAPKSKRIGAKDFGAISHANLGNPLVALSDYFRDQGITVQRLVVLLSRPELDLPTLNLPPAEESELPGLIASEVEQQLGETEEPPIVDYLVVANPKVDANTASQVLAFALPAKELNSLKKQVDETAFRLAAICSRHLAPLSILRRRNISSDTLVVSVHLYTGEVELAVCRGSDPILLRTIRLSTDDSARVAEQIWMEMQRCLTLLTQETAELKLDWYVFATNDAAGQVAKALEERGESSIHTIDPLSDWELDSSETNQNVDSPTRSAANAGAAWDFINNALPVNLLAPKRAPKPANPMVRWVGLGIGVASVVGIGLYFMLSDVWQLQREVDDLRIELDNAKKVAAKYQEKSDQVQAVQAWMSDQVDWLAELNDLSRRLPDGQDATVRRLTATAGPSAATIDLSVQVADQEFISQLESRIRSAKYSATSKQISQNASSAEYPWQFETKVSFPIEAQKQNTFGPKPVPSEPASPSDKPIQASESFKTDTKEVEVPAKGRPENNPPDSDAENATAQPNIETATPSQEGPK